MPVLCDFFLSTARLNRSLFESTSEKVHNMKSLLPSTTGGADVYHASLDGSVCHPRILVAGSDKSHSRVAKSMTSCGSGSSRNPSRRRRSARANVTADDVVANTAANFPHQLQQQQRQQVMMSACFRRLKQLVPTVSDSSAHLSKVQLLQHVIDYILDLENTLDFDRPVEVESPATTADGDQSLSPQHLATFAAADDDDCDIPTDEDDDESDDIDCDESAMTDVFYPSKEMLAACTTVQRPVTSNCERRPLLMMAECRNQLNNFGPFTQQQSTLQPITSTDS